MAPNLGGRRKGPKQMPSKSRKLSAQTRPVAFRSSRIEDLGSVDSDDVTSVRSIENVSDVSSSSEDAVGRPDYYNLLLQDLQSSEKRSLPPRKKRKLSPPSVRLLPVEDEETNKEQRRHDEPDQMEAEDAGDLIVSETLRDEPDEEEVSPDDPFEIHFSPLSNDRLAIQVDEIKSGSLFSQSAPFSSVLSMLCKKPATGVTGHNATSGSRRREMTDESFHIKRRIQRQAKAALAHTEPTVGPLSKMLFDYQDVLFCARSTNNASNLRAQACVHALNHVLKTRDKVIKNNSRLAKAEPDAQVEYRDQGFTRPKVLILLPTRQSCARYVEALMKLFQPEQQENKSRFTESFSQSDDAISTEKPRDFQDLFGGNDDDMFRLGLKLTRKTVKFFYHFYNSDFIFASPLGLRMAIGSVDSKDFDRDFLSSIEIVIVDHADALINQNWEHVAYIFESLNAQPRETHGCDFSRVREWYLDGNARYLRQSIVFTSFNTPETNQVFNRSMLNIAGKNRISQQSYEGVIGELGIHIKQTFSRFEAASPTLEPDSRFKYFTSAAFTAVKKHARLSAGKPAGILLFVPSYLDFVRVRNFLSSSVVAQDISFGAISEYTSVSETARARSHFFYGRHSLLLYTGRAHHFRRYKIRGVKRVLMYALPENPIFYQEIAGGFLAQSASEGLIEQIKATVQSIFSKWDVMRLERIVGTDRLAPMVRGKGSTFDFV